MTTFRPLYNWPSRRSRDKRVGRQSSLSVAPNPERGRLPAICKHFFIHLLLGRRSHVRLGMRPGVPERLTSHSHKHTLKSPMCEHCSTSGYARCMVCLYHCQFLLDINPHLTDDEEKTKRTSLNAVSVTSMITPDHTDMDTTTDYYAASPSATDLPPPPSGVILQTPSPPTLSPTGESSADHLITENDSGSRSETPSPSQTPPSFHDDVDNDPPPALLSPIHPQTESPVPSRSGTPTPGTILAPPLLVCAKSGTFDSASVHGDFISKDTCAYWESVPGGAKWIELVKNYLKLEAIPPIKSVSPTLIHTLSRQANNHV